MERSDFRKERLAAVRKHVDASGKATEREVMVALYKNGFHFYAAQLLFGVSRVGDLKSPESRQLFELVVKGDLALNMFGEFAWTPLSASAPAEKSEEILSIKFSDGEHLNLVGAFASLVKDNIHKTRRPKPLAPSLSAPAVA